MVGLKDFSFYPLSTVPAPYDIVWCRFPYNEKPDFPAPEHHPGLIRQSFADQDGNPWVRVVYGTSVDPFKAGNEYFTVANLPQMDMCGLKCATRFCLARHAELPWGPDFFDIHEGRSSPIIGHLSERLQYILQVQVSYWQQDQK